MKRKTALVTTLSLVLCASGFGLLAGACSDTKATPDGSIDNDGGIKPIEAGSDGNAPPPADCVKSPQNSTDILNQCPPEGTDYIDKTPVVPLLAPDGGLPPLP